MALLSRTQVQQQGGQQPPGQIDPVVGFQGQAQFGPAQNTAYGDLSRQRALTYDGSGQRVDPQTGRPLLGPQMGRVDFGQWNGGSNVPTPGFGNTINYGALGPNTRQIGPDELVENRITGLLDSDNPYIQNARRRGERAAAQRGGLSSSIFAGASEAAAINAALPIAAQDAQTYSRVASENAAAINQNTLARMNSMTSALTAQIGATAGVTNARIAAETNQTLGQMRIRAEENQTQFLAEQERFMQDVRQMDQMEIMELAQQYDIDLMGLQHGYNLDTMGQQFDYNMIAARVAQQYALQQQGYQGSINSYLQNNQLQAGFMQGIMNTVMSTMTFLSQQGMDAEGFDAAMSNAYQQLAPFISFANDMFGGGFGEITPPGGG